MYKTDYDYENQTITGLDYVCLSLEIDYDIHKEIRQTYDSPGEPGYLEITNIKIVGVIDENRKPVKLSVLTLEKIESILMDDEDFQERMTETICEDLYESEQFALSEHYDNLREEKYINDHYE